MTRFISASIARALIVAGVDSTEFFDFESAMLCSDTVFNAISRALRNIGVATNVVWARSTIENASVMVHQMLSTETMMSDLVCGEDKDTEHYQSTLAYIGNANNTQAREHLQARFISRMIIELIGVPNNGANNENIVDGIFDLANEHDDTATGIQHAIGETIGTEIARNMLDAGNRTIYAGIDLDVAAAFAQDTRDGEVLNEPAPRMLAGIDNTVELPTTANHIDVTITVPAQDAATDPNNLNPPVFDTVNELTLYIGANSSSFKVAGDGILNVGASNLRGNTQKFIESFKIVTDTSEHPVLIITGCSSSRIELHTEILLELSTMKVRGEQVEVYWLLTHDFVNVNARDLPTKSLAMGVLVPARHLTSGSDMSAINDPETGTLIGVFKSSLIRGIKTVAVDIDALVCNNPQLVGIVCAIQVTGLCQDRLDETMSELYSSVTIDDKKAGEMYAKINTSTAIGMAEAEVSRLSERITGMRAEISDTMKLFMAATAKLNMVKLGGGAEEYSIAKAKEDIEKMSSYGYVKIIMQDQGIYGYTDDVYVRSGGKKYDIGKLVVIIPYDAAYSGSIRIYNLTRTVKNMGEQHAPHVYNDGNNICWGDARNTMDALISEKKFGDAMCLARDFLNHANINDGAGRCLPQFPLVVDKPTRRFNMASVISIPGFSLEKK